MTREETAIAVLKEHEEALKARWMQEAVSQDDLTSEGDEKRRIGAMKLHVFDQILIQLRNAISNE